MKRYNDPLRPGLDWSPEKFRRWLESLPPDQVVGYPRSGTACPIAKYLKTQLWLDFRVVVTNEETMVDGRCSATPAWAQEFIDRMDARNETVTAGQALELLRAEL